jgi:hypothetical protein
VEETTVEAKVETQVEAKVEETEVALDSKLFLV